MQNVYENNSITRQFSNNNKKCGANNCKRGHCDLPIRESRIFYKLKDISSSPNTKNRILTDDGRLGGDDSVFTSGEGRIDFREVSAYIANAGSVHKRPSQAPHNIIINRISDSFCTTLYGLRAETTNSQPFLEKRLQQQSSSKSILHVATKLVDIKPKTVKQDVFTFSPGRIFDKVGCIKDKLRGWFCQKTSVGGVWSQTEQALHLNILELRAAKFAILTFCRYKKHLAGYV